MKAVKRLRLPLLSLFGGTCLLLADSALALQTFGGATCDPIASNGSTALSLPLPKLVRNFQGIKNDDTASNELACSTPVASIGTTNAAWQVVVTDNSTTKGFTCQGVVMNSSGGAVAVTPLQSTSNAFTGTTTLTLTTTSGGFSGARSLLVDCTIPPGSLINSIAVQ
jgi:hypothetical protein